MGRVQKQLIKATRSIHLELHKDPILCRLIEPDITLIDYLNALTVFHTFYHYVEMERMRFSDWHYMSLDKECSALQRDLPSLPVGRSTTFFNDELEMLGGLYVALGATFGRIQSRKNITKVLPEAPNAFINLRMSKNTWTCVTSTLETAGADAGDLARISSGATKSFLLVKSLTSGAPNHPSGSDCNGVQTQALGNQPL